MSAAPQPRPPMADLEGRKVLFVAYFFPPTVSTGVPGCMRTIKFLRNLQGGDCHVLTTTEAQLEDKDSALRHVQLPVHGETLHRVGSWDLFKALLALRTFIKSLLGKGRQPAQQPVTSAFKTSTDQSGPAASRSRLQRLKDFVYDLCYFPDQAGPWIIPAFFRGRRVVKKHRIDVIFATGSPWSGLIVGYLISRFTGKPLIVDFRDPWMNNPFHHSKGTMLDRWALNWEKRIVARAQGVSLNTEPLRQEFLERYPEQPSSKFFVMPNGYDLADFPALETSSTPNNRIITLCHVGFLYGVRDPATLLDAIQLANKTLAAEGRQVRFRQIGDVQLGYDIRERYQTMLADGSLILDAAQPYQACLQALSNADMVVNIQPATRSQVPSKLYDYLAINRPILNITPTDGALGHMVENYGLGELFDFNEAELLSQRLVELARSDATERNFSGYANRYLFDTRKTATDLAEKIKELTAP